MALYRAQANEMVDEICHLYYGRTQVTVEAVYEENPGLAELGPRLPVGTLIELPDVPEDSTKARYAELWN